MSTETHTSDSYEQALARVEALDHLLVECFIIARDATPDATERDSTVRRVACLATRYAHSREANDVLRHRIAALEGALRDAIETVESAPERCAGYSMLRTPQVCSTQLDRWRAALRGKEAKP